MKILNLFAGLGGNRGLWDKIPNLEITSVEINEDIATIYKKRFPKDIIIINDAIDYLEKNFRDLDFDFIWASPPCQTHSTMNGLIKNKKVPDCTSLWGLIIFLQRWIDKKIKWVVENVMPYYGHLISPSIKINRHYYWSNYYIAHKDFPRRHISKLSRQDSKISVKDADWKRLALKYGIDPCLIPNTPKS